MTWEGLSPPYATIVADPPWTYEQGGPDDGVITRGFLNVNRARQGSYSLRDRWTHEEIQAGPLAGIAGLRITETPRERTAKLKKIDA